METYDVIPDPAFGIFNGWCCTDIDLRQPLDRDAVADLRREWLDRTLLYFPDQNLSAVEFARFVHYFGQSEKLPLRNHHVDDRDVEILTNQTINGVAWDGYKNGQDWHSDRSYTTCPTAAIVLNAKEFQKSVAIHSSPICTFDRLSSTQLHPP